MPITGFAAWYGRYGLKNTYWHGKQKPTDVGCRCYLGKTCDTMIETNTNLCNCDSRYPQSIDKGILRSGWIFVDNYHIDNYVEIYLWHKE